MQQVPECPRCGVEVQPHWDRCEECGYSHHDDPDPLGSAAPPSAPSPGFFDAPAPGSLGGAPSAAGSDEPVSFDLPPDPDRHDAPPPPPPPPPPFEPVGPVAPAPEFGPGPGPAAPSGFGPGPSGPPGFGPGPGPSTPPAADPLAAWEVQASSAPGGAPRAAADPAPLGGAGREDPPKRTGKRITAADGARARSPFQLNKVVVIIAVVLAAGVLAWQASALLKEEPKAAPTTGTTVPPLGEIVTTTTPLTTPDGVVIPPPETTTTTINTAPQCDSSSSVFSADGKGYRPCGAGFQIDLPGRADIRTSTGETALGPVRWTSLTSTDNTKDPWVRSVVVYGDLPREITPEEVAGVQEALVAQLIARPGEQTTFQDLPALTFTGSDANGDDIVGITFVNGTKAYALATRSNGSPQAGFDALRDSFAFI